MTRTTNYCTKLRNSTKKRLSAIRKTTSFTNDFLYQASQQYEEEAERHLVERYQHMQDEDFGLDRLMEEAERHLVEADLWSPH